MKIRNNKNNANYVNYKFDGFAKKVFIPAGRTVDVSDIKDIAQILNIGDFDRGFFELIKEEGQSTFVFKASSEKEEDPLEKIKKQVKNYTNNEE